MTIRQKNFEIRLPQLSGTAVDKNRIKSDNSEVEVLDSEI